MTLAGTSASSVTRDVGVAPDDITDDVLISLPDVLGDVIDAVPCDVSALLALVLSLRSYVVVTGPGGGVT